MQIEVTNLSIGETVIIDTDEWDETTEVRNYSDENYFVVIHNDWEYLVKGEDFEAYIVLQTMMVRSIGC